MTEEVKEDMSGGHICAMCEGSIVESTLVEMNGMYYHTKCLTCCVCNAGLGSERSCFVKDGKVYCRSDYYRTYGSARCAKCTLWIQSTDLVHKIRGSVYHIQCLSCDFCHRQLSTGDQFVLQEDKVCCTNQCGGGVSPVKNQRTWFSEEQKKQLKSIYQVNPYPRGYEISNIAIDLGLSVDVIRTWFQNRRAAHKRKSI